MWGNPLCSRCKFIHRFRAKCGLTEDLYKVEFKTKNTLWSIIDHAYELCHNEEGPALGSKGKGGEEDSDSDSDSDAREGPGKHHGKHHFNTPKGHQGSQMGTSETIHSHHHMSKNPWD